MRFLSRIELFYIKLSLLHNKLERDFQSSKYHLISQRENLYNGLYDRFG